MLDISRSMSKAYADLVSNFLSTLTNLVLLRCDAYLRHAHPNLDAFRVRNLHAAPVSGGDLFERSLMQEYEQHLIGLGVKPGSEKEQRFHPYKKSKKGRGGHQQAPQGVYYQPMPAPQYMVQQPFFQPPPQGGRRGGCGGRRGRSRGGSTGGNKQQQPPQWHSIPSATFTKPWIRTDNAFRRSLTLCFPCNPSRGGEDSEFVIPTGEGKDSMYTVPKGGGKDSVCTTPTGGGKDSVCSPHQRGRKLWLYNLRIHPI